MAKTAKKAKIAHGTGVCQFAYKLIRDGKTNDQVLAAVMKKFPDSRIGVGGVNWCRNKLRKDGEKGIKTNTELKAKKAKGKSAADKLAA